MNLIILVHQFVQLSLSLAGSTRTWDMKTRALNLNWLLERNLVRDSSSSFKCYEKILITPGLCSFSTKWLCVLLKGAVMWLPWSDIITVLIPSSRRRLLVRVRICFVMLFMLHTKASNIFVLLTFGQPAFKELFNLSKRCRGSKQHLNYTVSANILHAVMKPALQAVDNI